MTEEEGGVYRIIAGNQSFVMFIGTKIEEVRSLLEKYKRCAAAFDHLMWCVFLTKQGIEFYNITQELPKKPVEVRVQ